MTQSNGTYEFVGSGFREYMVEEAKVSREAYDITDRLMGDYADPQVMSLSEDTIAKIVEVGRNLGKDDVVTITDIGDKIFAGAPGIKSESVRVRGDGEVSFIGDLDIDTTIRMSFDFEEALPNMIALYDATKGINAQLKAMAGAVDQEELEEVVEMLESENIDNPDLKGYLVWLDRKTGKLYEANNERLSDIEFVATLDDDPTIYDCKAGKIARTQSQGAGFTPSM